MRVRPYIERRELAEPGETVASMHVWFYKNGCRHDVWRESQLKLLLYPIGRHRQPPLDHGEVKSGLGRR